MAEIKTMFKEYNNSGTYFPMCKNCGLMTFNKLFKNNPADEKVYPCSHCGELDKNKYIAEDVAEQESLWWPKKENKLKAKDKEKVQNSTYV